MFILYVIQQGKSIQQEILQNKKQKNKDIPRVKKIIIHYQDENQDIEVSLPEVNNYEDPQIINITYNKVILIYHEGDVIMENTGINECKATVMEVNTTVKLHGYYLL